MGIVSTASADTWDACQLYICGADPIGGGWSDNGKPKFVAMTRIGETNTYYKEFTLTADKDFSISRTNSAVSWDYYNNTDNKLRFSVGTTDNYLGIYGGTHALGANGDHKNWLAAGTYRIEVNSETMEMYVSPKLSGRSYYVVGNNSRAFGSEWSVSDGALQMTGTSNVYTYVKTGVKLLKGSHFKWKVLMKDGDNDLNWNYGYAGSGYVGSDGANISKDIDANGIYTITFTFDLNSSVVPTATFTKTGDYTPDYICYVKDETSWINTTVYAWSTDKPNIFGGWNETIDFTPETETIGSITYKKFPFIASDGNFEFIFTEGGSDNTEGYRVTKNGFSTADRNLYVTLTTSDATITKSTINVTATKEYSTFCNTNNLDFDGITGLEAYRVSEVTKTAAKMAQVTAVPGGQGLILKKTANVGSATFQVPIIASAESIGDNALVGVTDASGLDMSTVSNAYILSDGLFYECNEGTLAAGKAYLSTAAWAGSKETSFYMIFEDENETNAINAVKLNTENGAIYNLAGQRVSKDYKGIIIVNGKKMLNK